MLIRDYTKPELEHFIEYCNFTESEMQYFLLKSRDYSNIRISVEMNVSEPQVSILAKRVKSKIQRIQKS